jgi:hypothetical protein
MFDLCPEGDAWMASALLATRGAENLNRKLTLVPLALTAAGAVLMLTDLIPSAPLSIKVIGFVLLVTGLARLRVTRQGASWLRSRFGRVAGMIDQGAGESEAPLATLDELLGAVQQDSQPPQSGAGHQP